jgi:hypothetical protein
MNINFASSKGWRLWEAPFPFQQTYVTHERDLSRFVHTLLGPFEFNDAAIGVETIVFTPHELIAYLNSFGIVTEEGEEGALNGAVIRAADASEAATLLECVFGEWIDFAFIPSPKTFVIYADHDNYTTVFTATPELLVSVRSAMDVQKFKAVDDWFWTGPHSQGALEEGSIDV